MYNMLAVFTEIFFFSKSMIGLSSDALASSVYGRSAC